MKSISDWLGKKYPRLALAFDIIGFIGGLAFVLWLFTGSPQLF